MDCLRYELDEWVTVTHNPLHPDAPKFEGPLDLSHRDHRLFFACGPVGGRGGNLPPRLTGADFLVCGCVNADEFLVARPGLLCCLRAAVYPTLPEPAAPMGAPPDALVAELLENRKRQRWVVRYDFREHAAQGWNELFVPAGGGRLRRQAAPFCDVTLMAEFFGRADFGEFARREGGGRG